MKVLKCKSCGAVIVPIKDCKCPCGFECCDEKMVEVIPNSVDANVEKHVPDYVIDEHNIEIKVNHVMEEDHYIEWVAMESNNKTFIRYFEPGEEADVVFEYLPGSTLYSYCNKHGLWKIVVE